MIICALCNIPGADDNIKAKLYSMDGSGVIPVIVGFSRGASFFIIHTEMYTLRNIKLFILKYSDKDRKRDSPTPETWYYSGRCRSPDRYGVRGERDCP